MSLNKTRKRAIAKAVKREISHAIPHFLKLNDEGIGQVFKSFSKISQASAAAIAAFCKAFDEAMKRE